MGYNMAEASINDLLFGIPYDPLKSDVKRQKTMSVSFQETVSSIWVRLTLKNKLTSFVTRKWIISSSAIMK